MNFFKVFLFTTLLFLSTQSCNDQNIGTAFLRVVMVSPDTSSIDIYDSLSSSQQGSEFNADLVASNLQYTQDTAFPVNTGNTTYNVFNQGDNPQTDTALLDLTTVNIAADTYYTLFITGLTGFASNALGIQGALFVDNREGAGAGLAKIRILHLSPDTSAIYVFLGSSSPLDSNGDGSVTSSDQISFTGDTPYQTVSVGDITIEVDTDTDATDALATSTVTLEENKNYTLFLHGCNSPTGSGCGSNTLTLSLLTDN